MPFFGAFARLASSDHVSVCQAFFVKSKGGDNAHLLSAFIWPEDYFARRRHQILLKDHNYLIENIF